MAVVSIPVLPQRFTATYKLTEKSQKWAGRRRCAGVWRGFSSNLREGGSTLWLPSEAKSEYAARAPTTGTVAVCAPNLVTPVAAAQWAAN